MIAAAVAAYAETRVGSACLFFSAFGVAATGFVHSFPQLVAVTVFWSVFMHQWFTSSSAIPLALAKGKEGGRHLGRMGAVGAAATILAFVVAHFLAGRPLPRLLRRRRRLHPDRRAAAPADVRARHYKEPAPPAYRREYGLFYGLTFLEGCRRQIFSTFALFALVQYWHTPLSQMTTLMLVNAVATFVVAAPAGRLIDRIGERRSMTIYYAAIALAFFGYAVSRDPGTLKVLYVIDNILFSLGVSITTYLNRIVRPGELMPTLSMGQTMNHVAAVAVPVSGGLLWHAFGYHAPSGPASSPRLISLALTQTVRHHQPMVAAAEA